MERGRIVIDRGVLPTIPQVARKAVVHGEPVAKKNAEPARGEPVMHMDLGEALGQVVYDVVDRVRKRNVDERPVGKNALDLATEALVEPVVVVDVKKTTTCKILPEPLHFRVRKLDVA